MIDWLNDLFKSLLAAIFLGMGRLFITIISLGFVRIAQDGEKLDFPLYGVVQDANGKVVVSQNACELIGILISCVIFVAAFMLLAGES